MLRSNVPQKNARNAPRPTAPHPTAPRPTAPRNASLDIARLIASFGIVVFHLGAPGAAIGYAALPFFLMLLIILALPSARTKSFQGYARGRAERLLVPWLIWSAIYGLLKLIGVWRADGGLADGGFSENPQATQSLADAFHGYMLLTGPEIHLWFLPFAFVASLTLPAVLAVWPPSRGGQAVGGQAVGVLAFLAVALAVLCWMQGCVLPVPLAQWCYVMPALAVGLALALSKDHPVLRKVFTLGTVGLFSVALTFGWTEGLLQLALAISAVLVCFAVKVPKSRFSQICAETSVGVYLVHPLMLMVALKLPLPASSLPAQSLRLTVAVMALSFAFSLAVNAVKHHLSRRRLYRAVPQT